MILHSFIFYLISLHGIACHFIALYGIAWYCIVIGFFARYRTVMYRCHSAPANYRVVHLVIFICLQCTAHRPTASKQNWWSTVKQKLGKTPANKTDEFSLGGGSERPFGDSPKNHLICSGFPFARMTLFKMYPSTWSLLNKGRLPGLTMVKRTGPFRCLDLLPKQDGGWPIYKERRFSGLAFYFSLVRWDWTMPLSFKTQKI